MKHTSYRTPLYGIRCHHGAWWLGRGFEAITWFGHIFFNCTKEELEAKLVSPALLRTERHEHVHLLQAKTFRTRYLGFYILYVAYWLRNLVRYRNTMKAYYEIPFEREAYACEDLEDYQQSRWREYRKVNS